MLEAALWVAMACALCGALTGNRAAWVLVPSAALCLYLDCRGVPFNWVRWVTMDLVAMALIAGIVSKLTRMDWAILLLFPVGWVAYAMGDPIRYIGTMLVTIAQLLLTFPLARFRARLRQYRSPADRWDEFDLLVRA